MIERTPITDPNLIEVFDEAEIIEGYHDGRDNFPCGDNRSMAYWHGWRNGRVDGKHAEPDAAQIEFAHRWVEKNRTKGSGGE